MAKSALHLTKYISLICNSREVDIVGVGGWHHVVCLLARIKQSNKQAHYHPH
jgi:hypothetical protein